MRKEEEKPTLLQQVYYKHSNEYLEHLNSYNQKYEAKGLSVAEEYNLDKEAILKLMTGILQDAQHIEGLIIKQSSGSFRGVKILEYSSSADFRIIILDRNKLTANLVSKGSGIIVYTDGIGEHVGKSVQRLPNNINKYVKELLDSVKRK